MKVKAVDQRSISPWQKRDFQERIIVYLTCGLKVRDHKGQGKKDTWVKGQGHYIKNHEFQELCA